METAPMSFMQAVLAYVVVPLLPILGTALAALLGMGVKYLHEKAKASKTAAVFASFSEAAASVVAQLEAEVRPTLQQALADGTLSPEEAAELKQLAITKLKAELPAGLLASASKLFGGFLDTWLGGLVERANASQKALEPVLQG